MLTYREYINYAEKYLSLAEKSNEKNEEISWLLIPSTILAWSAIESFVNNMLEDFSSLPEGIFEFHERAFLLEKRLKLSDKGKNIGKFVLDGSEYKRIEDKIFFLVAKFSSKNPSFSKGDSLWNDFEKFKDVRNNLVHPRKGNIIELQIEEVEEFISVSKKIITLLSKCVWKKDIDFY